MKYSILLILVIIVSCSSPKPRKPVSHSSGTTYIEASIKRNKALLKMEEELFKKIIKKDSLHNYISSPNGFWYFYNHKVAKAGYLPKLVDEVIFSLEIRAADNQVIYSKETLGMNTLEKGFRSLHIDAEEFISGVHEGLKLMQETEVATFLFPSNKVFGATGYQDRISPNQSLIIEIYLKKINKHKTNN